MYADLILREASGVGVFRTSAHVFSNFLSCSISSAKSPALTRDVAMPFSVFQQIALVVEKVILDIEEIRRCLL